MMKKWIKRSVALICSLLFVVFASCAYVEKGLNFLFPKDSSYSGSSTQSSLSADDSSSSSENISSSDSNSSSSASSEDSSSSVECKHRYGGWETVVEATCKPGMKERVCAKCGETEQEEIPLIFTMHTFNSQTLCTTCGHQEFIESEEYIEEIIIAGYVRRYYWTSVDGSYTLHIGYQLDGRLYIVVYWGTPVNMVLPSQIKGEKISFVGANGQLYSFEEGSTLKNLVMVDGIENIYGGSFDGCTSLESVVCPKTLKRISGYAFGNCTSLKEVILPKSMEYMSSYAFSGCSSLRGIYYEGTKEEWEIVGQNSNWESTSLLKRIAYYYSETEPQKKGKYWHYINNQPVLW